MEAVGRLAGGIAHDFNNVLPACSPTAKVLVEETPDGSPLKRYAQNVLTAATVVAVSSSRSSAYSRSQRGKRAPSTSPVSWLGRWSCSAARCPPRYPSRGERPQRPLVVIGDATNCTRVVTNLCSNAIQAMSGGGTLRVALETTDVSASEEGSRTERSRRAATCA
jgi:signal transduction histidine kinase